MAETPDNAEAAELHQVSVELWLIGRRDEALLAFRQALGGATSSSGKQCIALGWKSWQYLKLCPK